MTAEPLDHFEALEQDLESFNEMDQKGLARQWRTLVGGTMPEGLGRVLTLRILSYHLQARRYGDLDRASRQSLTNAFARALERAIGQLDGAAQPKGRRLAAVVGVPHLRPGSVLTREHRGTLHRVIVTKEGFSWNGEVYDSLSKVALAITGTRWNGPRFFGLRNAATPSPKKRRATQKKPLNCSSTARQSESPP